VKKMQNMNEVVAIHDPDHDLVARARGGDFTAFEALVMHYESQVFSLARRIVRELHDVEEVVQETFLSVLEHLNSFRGDAPFRAWLMRIATNTALKLLRRRRNQRSVVREEEDSLPHPQFVAPWQQDVAELAGRAEIRWLIDEALTELDEKYRLVFVLRDIQELSVEETAGALQISPANVKVRLMRARLMLRERLTRALGDPARAAPAHRHCSHPPPSTIEAMPRRTSWQPSASTRACPRGDFAVISEGKAVCAGGFGRFH
jgi:RNA polymerase sigma-70 factor, ECF subfamily